MNQNNSKKSFLMNILEIQPTQLFVSEEKLNSVKKWLINSNNFTYDPIPIKKLNDKVIFVDGHTRALALYNLGFKTILVEWEPEEWDWEAYQICVDWCLESKIRTISDLCSKIIDKDSYEILWHDRCRKMQKKLKEKRANKY